MRFSLFLLSLLPLTASAADAVCQKPGGRDIAPIQEAIKQDEAMAAAFDATSMACVHGTVECDDSRLRCGNLLTETLRDQVRFDEGAYLRDMLVLFSGQHYNMQTPVPSAPPLTDVSCNAESDTLKQAAARRRQQAERRKLLLAEYPRWVAWTQGASQACYAGLAADQKRQDQAAVDAAKLAAAAELARTAEEQRQADAKAAALREQKMRDEAARARLAAEDQAKQQQLDAQRAQQDAAEKAAKEKAAAEAKAKRDAELAAENAAVQERETKKAAARQHQEELIAAERKRQEDARQVLAQQQQAAKADHEKRIADLQKNIALSEGERDAAIAQANKDFESAEAKREADAQKEIEAAGLYDRSDERNIGAIGAHAAGGYFAVNESANNNTASGPLVGGQVTLHQGFWGTAPSHGMAAGLELRGVAVFMTSVGSGGSAQVIHLVPEIRYWFGRLGVGLVFEWQQMASEVATMKQTAQVLGLGGSVSLAGFDTPDARLLLTAKWTPLLNNHLERLTGEVEAGYQWFSLFIGGGALSDDGTGPAGGNKRTGWYVGGGLGGRFRW